MVLAALILRKYLLTARHRFLRLIGKAFKVHSITALAHVILAVASYFDNVWVLFVYQSMVNPPTDQKNRSPSDPAMSGGTYGK